MQRIRRLAYLLDESIRIPGTRLRIGLDGLVGFIPVVGDFATAAASLYILYEARRFGVPRPLMARMLGNVVLDLLLGTVPVIGDVIDFSWKANSKNLRLLQRELQRRAKSSGRQRTGLLSKAENRARD